jgi:hypothetical protein
MPFGSWPVLVMTVEELVRAVGAGSKRFCVCDPARSVITRRHCQVALNWSMSRRRSGRQEEASGQQIDSRSAKHLTLQHLQAINLPFDRALTPRQRHCCLDGGIVLVEPSGEAPKGRESTRGGARQPRLELGRLVLRTRPAKSCASATASASAGDCSASCAS